MAFPGKYDFNYYRGDRHNFVVKPKNSNGSTYNLDGFSGATFTIANKRGPGSTKYVGQAIIDTATDTIACTILPSIGKQLSAGTYVFEVQVTADVATIFTFVTGTITVTDGILGAA